MNHSHFLCRFAVALIVVVLVSLSANTQALVKLSDQPQRQGESHKEYPPDEVGLLKHKVEQLQAVVEKQQRLVEELERRVKKLEEKSSAGGQTK